MSRGKKRIGYDLEIKVKFSGQGPKAGYECAMKLAEFCDDGSQPESKLFVTKDRADVKNGAALLKKEMGE